jgi:hypothetical protein
LANAGAATARASVAASAAGKESVLLVVMFVLLDSRGIRA